jgi:MFS family permease
MLIVGRAVQGIGGSGLLTGAFNIIAAIAAPEKRPSMSFSFYSIFLLMNRSTKC